MASGLNVASGMIDMYLTSELHAHPHLMYVYLHLPAESFLVKKAKIKPPVPS